MKLAIGSSPHNLKPVSFDLAALLESRLLVQANSGAGKSWLLRRLLELTYGHVQQIVLDVEDEFYTLRKAFPDYVLGGRAGGDCPAEPRSADLLARKLLELEASAILGIYELKAHERGLFVERFLDALVNAPKELWHPVLVVVDEAHMFAPEGEKAASTGAVIDLMTRGRKRGFCGVLATQRISKLHKDAAAECNNKLIGRSGLDVDMVRSSKELGFTKDEQRLSLRSLKPGHFYAFGPAISDAVIEVEVGPVQTEHPRAGARQAAPPAASKKAKSLLAKLADLPAQAEEEIRSMAEARRKIADLERAMRTRPAATAAPVPKKKDVARMAAEVRRYKQALGVAMKFIVQVNAAELAGKGLTDEERATLVKAVEAAVERGTTLLQTKLDQRGARIEGMKAKAAQIVKELRTLLDEDVTVEVDIHKREAFEVAPARDEAPPRAPRGTVVPVNGLGKGETLVLTAVAQYPKGADREQVSILTGYKRSTRDAYVQRIGAAGLVVQRADLLFATDAGLAALGPGFQALPTGRALYLHWLGELPEGEKKVLQAVVQKHPTVADRDWISEVTGYKRSTRDAYIQRLSTRKLVAAERTGVSAAAILFD